MPSTSDPDSLTARKINKIVLHVLKRLIRDADQTDLQRQSQLRTAFKSLDACPVPFDRVKDLVQLKGFDSRDLRDELAQGVAVWRERKATNFSMVDGAAGTAVTRDVVEVIFDETPSTSARKRKSSPNILRPRQATLYGTAADPDATSASKSTTKLYIPQARTGTHGILVALYALTPERPPDDEQPHLMRERRGKKGDESLQNESYHSKATIISVAQPFSDARYVPKKAPAFAAAQGVHSFNSAWSGMKTMINRAYVYRAGNPARFGLSAVGWDVAKICAAREADIAPGCKLHCISDDMQVIDAEEPSGASDRRRKHSRQARDLFEEGLTMLKKDAEYSAAARATLDKMSRYHELVYGS